MKTIVTLHSWLGKFSQTVFKIFHEKMSLKRPILGKC